MPQPNDTDNQPIPQSMNNDKATKDQKEVVLFINYHKMVAKLLVLLDSWGAPDSGFQDIVNLYAEATQLNVSFINHIKTRHAAIDALHTIISNSIPCILSFILFYY